MSAELSITGKSLKALKKWLIDLIVSTNTKYCKGKPRVFCYIYISSENSLTLSVSYYKPTMVNTAAIYIICNYYTRYKPLNFKNISNEIQNHIQY